MPYVFTVERGPRPGLQLSLKEDGRMRMGRSARADLVLPAEDRKVAPIHAELRIESGVVTIKPLDSAWPTRVNGKLTTEPTSLAVGDVVQVGDTHLVLGGGDAQEDSPDAAPELTVTEVVENEMTPRLESPDRPSVEASKPVKSDANLVMVSGAVIVETEKDVLTCTHCSKAGIAPPRPDLWDAAWICDACVKANRVSGPRIPCRLGNYDVIRPLARGGMGVVYEGVARDNNLHVAIKVMSQGKGATERQVQRFIREQHITKTLRHPNIVCCYDAGTWEESLYIVYEFVAGGDALSVASSSSSLQEVLWLGADLFRALGYGHDLGIVHRDVKPANLLLAKSRAGGTMRGKLADFGLAKSFMELGGQPLTMGDESGGSLLTIGPEQLTNFKKMPFYGDLYAGAATVFWLLTGDSPLVLPVPTEKASFEQKLHAILDKRRKSLRDHRPDVPESVATLIDGLVAHDESTRSGKHAREVAVALNAAASELSRRPTSQRTTITRVVEAEPSVTLREVVQQPGPREEPERTTTVQDQLQETMDALERCIHMLERSVQRAALEVKAAAGTDDTERIERVVSGHEQAQADLEAALARWEKIVAASKTVR